MVKESVRLTNQDRRQVPYAKNVKQSARIYLFIGEHDPRLERSQRHSLYIWYVLNPWRNSEDTD